MHIGTSTPLLPLAATKSTGCICAISRQTSTRVACPFDNLSAGKQKQLSPPYWLKRGGHRVWIADGGYEAVAWSVSLMRVRLMSLTVCIHHSLAVSLATLAVSERLKQAACRKINTWLLWNRSEGWVDAEIKLDWMMHTWSWYTCCMHIGWICLEFYGKPIYRESKK